MLLFSQGLYLNAPAVEMFKVCHPFLGTLSCRWTIPKASDITMCIPTVPSRYNHVHSYACWSRFRKLPPPLPPPNSTIISKLCNAHVSANPNISHFLFEPCSRWLRQLDCLCCSSRGLLHWLSLSGWLFKISCLGVILSGGISAGKNVVRKQELHRSFILTHIDIYALRSGAVTDDPGAPI